MSIIFVDRLSHVGLHNGVLRIECIETGPNGQERSSGTLMIAGNQAAQVLKSLVNAAQELDKKIREQQAQQQAQQAPTVGNA